MAASAGVGDHAGRIDQQPPGAALPECLLQRGQVCRIGLRDHRPQPGRAARGPRLQTALGIEICQHHLLAARGQVAGQLQSQCGFAGTALTGTERNDVHGCGSVLPMMITVSCMVSRMIPYMIP